MTNNNIEPKIKFVENLGIPGFGPSAICLEWIDEIHIDKKYEEHQHIGLMIKHELKHYYLFKRIRSTKSHTKRFGLFLYNNLWDNFSCFKLRFYFNKPQFAIDVIILTIIALFFAYSLMR